MKSKISVVVNTLNEEKNLERALKSVKSLADEIIVVDMHSDDKTRNIAKKHGAKVYMHKKMGFVEPARNFALGKANGDWILVLDADEEITNTLAKKLRKISANPEVDFYAVPRKNIVFGKWLKHSRWWPDSNIRFFKKNSVEWMNRIHSVPITQGSGQELDSLEKFAIIHHNYESVEQFITRLNRYTGVQAKELKKNGKKYKWQDLLRRPTAEFLSRYFAGEGYKDGVHGLAVSLLQAFSEFVVVVKLWELSKFPEREVPVRDVAVEMRNNHKEVNYWVHNALVSEHGGIVHKFKRKFKLQ